MEDVEILDRFINICKSFYNYASMAIKTEEGSTNFREIDKGVLQGETPGALLFLIFINDLVGYFALFGLRGFSLGNSGETNALGYADNYILLAETYTEMLKKIRVLEEYCDKNNLKLNISKSKILIFHNGNINTACSNFITKMIF